MGTVAPASAYWWTGAASGASGPMGREHGPLTTRGRDFIDEDGREWPFVGYAIHYLINQMFDPDPEKIHRVLDEPIELGFNTIICVDLHASDWKTQNGRRCTPLEHPDWYQQYERMLDVAMERKIRLADATWADVQYMPKSFDQQQHWRLVNDIRKGRWNIFARTGNEWPSNGYYPLDFPYPDMQGVLCSHGSHGGKRNPLKPFLDWEEFELRRDLPKMFVDAPLRQLNDGDYEGATGPINRPLVSIEPIVFNDTNPDEVGDDDRSTDPRVALELAMLTACCAGGGFHASLGMDAKRLGPIARQCAEQYVRGLRTCFLRPLAALDFQGHH